MTLRNRTGLATLALALLAAAIGPGCGGEAPEGAAPTVASAAIAVAAPGATGVDIPPLSARPPPGADLDDEPLPPGFPAELLDDPFAAPPGLPPPAPPPEPPPGLPHAGGPSNKGIEL